MRYQIRENSTKLPPSETVKEFRLREDSMGVIYVDVKDRRDTVWIGIIGFNLKGEICVSQAKIEQVGLTLVSF